MEGVFNLYLDLDVLVKHLSHLAHRNDQCWGNSKPYLQSLEKVRRGGTLLSRSQEKMPAMVTSGCNPSNWEAGAEGSQVQSHPVHVVSHRPKATKSDPASKQTKETEGEGGG